MRKGVGYAGSGNSLLLAASASRAPTNESSGLSPRDCLAPQASIAELYRLLVQVSAARGPGWNWFVAGRPQQQECRVGPPGLPVKGAAQTKSGPDHFTGSDNSRGGDKEVCEVTRDPTVGLTTPLSSFLGRNLRLKICHKERPGSRVRGEGCQKIVTKSHKDSPDKFGYVSCKL